MVKEKRKKKHEEKPCNTPTGKLIINKHEMELNSIKNCMHIIKTD